MEIDSKSLSNCSRALTHQVHFQRVKNGEGSGILPSCKLATVVCHSLWMWAEVTRLLSWDKELYYSWHCRKHVIHVPWAPKLLESDMDVNQGDAVCTAVCTTLSNPVLFVKGLPNLLPGDRHYLYNPGQEMNLPSARLSLSSNAASCTNILAKVLGNRSWYSMQKCERCMGNCLLIKRIFPKEL